MEEKFVIEGGARLVGTVPISGSKNAGLPILAATLLTPDKCVLSGVPRLADISNMARILSEIGAQLSCQGHQVTVQAKELHNSDQLSQLARKMRASFLIMAPLLVRLGEATLPLPGGCAIGRRPIDLHLKGLAALGTRVEIERGFVHARADLLKGGEVHLDYPSVGATENILMAASCARGVTWLHNAAKEPEIQDLALFLKKMGARISGEGTSLIRIEGTEQLGGAVHTVIPDRIEAGTFMVAAVATRGELLLKRVVPGQLLPIIDALRQAGGEIGVGDDEILVGARGRLRSLEIVTAPYPGFPTDLQPQFGALLTLAEGNSRINERVFDRRFLYVDELRRMGACIQADEREAVICGVDQLTGAQVEATDLRAGAALVIAALEARGVSEINNIFHLDRGYEMLEDKLKAVGGRIRRTGEQAANL